MQEHFFIGKSADSAEVGYGDSAEKGYGDSAIKGYRAKIILVVKNNFKWSIFNYYEFLFFWNIFIYTRFSLL